MNRSGGQGGTVVLGAGVSGLAVGMTSRGRVFEAADGPGGICSSYYLAPGSTTRLPAPPADGEAYRFELGGGHWIFGGDPDTLAFIDELSPTRSYQRRAAVRLRGPDQLVPYPLQDHVDLLAARNGHTGESAAVSHREGTMAEWMASTFGPRLCDMFFYPFHERYTAGLYQRVAPQDSYKSPATTQSAAAKGYNVTFRYPAAGLDHLTQAMAAQADVRFGHHAVNIDTEARTVGFADGTEVGWQRLLCTLPLNRAVEMAGVDVGCEPDPHSSVLTLNVGAAPGRALSADHWVYEPASTSGFFRVGNYGAVDVDFLPRSKRTTAERVGLYVERAYDGAVRPDAATIERDIAATVAELQEMDLVGAVDVVDPTWIDCAYTWTVPGSTWREEALAALAERGVEQVGRYARWHFQGIADSIRDGLAAGRSTVG